MSEKLVAAALVRDGVTESRGFRSHWEIRAALGDDDPTKSRPGDDEGFLTDTGRFVTRSEARDIGIASGQLAAGWRQVRRDLLSSDINWGAA